MLAAPFAGVVQFSVLMFRVFMSHLQHLCSAVWVDQYFSCQRGVHHREDVFGDAPILHLSHMAEPRKSAFSELGRKTCTLECTENLGVINLVTPADAKDAAEAAQMEAVQFVLLVRIGCPCFTAIEESILTMRGLQTAILVVSFWFSQMQVS